MQSFGKKITELGNHYDNEQMGTYVWLCDVSVLNDNKLHVWVTKVMIVTGVCDSEIFFLV